MDAGLSTTVGCQTKSKPCSGTNQEVERPINTDLSSLSQMYQDCTVWNRGTAFSHRAEKAGYTKPRHWDETQIVLSNRYLPRPGLRSKERLLAIALTTFGSRQRRVLTMELTGLACVCCMRHAWLCSIWEPFQTSAILLHKRRNADIRRCGVVLNTRNHCRSLLGTPRPACDQVQRAECTRRLESLLIGRNSIWSLKPI